MQKEFEETKKEKGKRYYLGNRKFVITSNEKFLKWSYKV